jgi:predicted lipoprotein with Yx(FWY)xxD motif
MSIRGALPRVVIATLAAAGLTACGGSEESTGTHAAAHPARTAQPAARTGPASLTVRRSRLGPMLVDASGRSLYLFTQDKSGKPACTSDYLRCTDIWKPVVTSGRPHGGGGVRTGLLGVVRRTKPAGSQVTYNGHPLYRTVADKHAGDLNGQAMYDYWYVVSPSGRAIGRK